MSDQSSNPGQISDFKLKFSYWYVTNKLKLRRWLVISLVILNLGLFGFAGYRATMMLFIEQQDYDRMIFLITDQDLINYSYYREANRPQPIRMTGFSAIAGTEGSYDFVVDIGNTNEDWVAKEVKLQLLVANNVLEEKSIFVYPGEDKYIGFFNLEGVNPGSIRASIVDVDWERFNNFSQFAESRLNFIVSDVEFTPASELNVQGDLPISTLKFNIKNNTAYSYWDVGIYMVLTSGQRLSGANFISVKQFKSGETRAVEMRWYSDIAGVVDVLVFPQVDVLDEGSYMPVE